MESVAKLMGNDMRIVKDYLIHLTIGLWCKFCHKKVQSIDDDNFSQPLNAYLKKDLAFDWSCDDKTVVIVTSLNDLEEEVQMETYLMLFDCLSGWSYDLVAPVVSYVLRTNDMQLQIDFNCRIVGY